MEIDTEGVKHRLEVKCPDCGYLTVIEYIVYSGTTLQITSTTCKKCGKIIEQRQIGGQKC